MNELLTHLSDNNFPLLYLDEVSQTTEYDNLKAFLYKTIKRAIQEDADRIQATTQSLMWSRDGKVISKIDEGYSDYPSNYANQLREILAKDPIVQKWTRVISDTDSGIVCEFLS